MGISLIICHYAPEIKYRDILIDTLKSIHSQKFDDEIETIIVDDGSIWSEKILNPGEDLIILNKLQIKEQPLLNDMNIDYYILKRRNNYFNKPLLCNKALEIVKNEYIIFLDDDHSFASINALTLYREYFKKYDFVIGRIKRWDGIYHLYPDRRVQGTNFGIKKQLIQKIGAFEPKSSHWGLGEDSDLFYKIFKELTKDSADKKKACYAYDIMTIDNCSGRWYKCIGGVDEFFKGFQEIHGVHPKISNPYRQKSLWVEHTCKFPFLLEAILRINNIFFRIKIFLKSFFSIKTKEQ